MIPVTGSPLVATVVAAASTAGATAPTTSATSRISAPEHPAKTTTSSGLTFINELLQ